jgi:hypothetical protein
MARRSQDKLRRTTMRTTMWTTVLKSISRAECGALQLLPIQGGFSRETRTTSSIFLRRAPSSYTCCPSFSRVTSTSSPVTPYHSYITGVASNYVPGDDDREWGYYDKCKNFHPTSPSSSQRYQRWASIHLYVCHGLLWMCF